MKEFKTIYTLFAAATLFVSSCKNDFLDEKPYSSYSTSNINNSTLEGQVVGLHRTFAELWGWSGQQGFVSIFQIGTDVTSAGATQGVENPFYQYADLNSDNAGVAFLWQKCYDFINHANLVIANAGDNTKAAAEAKFFRAYAYNILVTLWGDVPLIKEPVKVPTFNYTRQPVAEVDQLIDEDLTYAIANLLEVDKAPSASRINKDIARQLAAEVYLRIGRAGCNGYHKWREV